MRIEKAEFSRSAVGASDFPRDGRPQVAFVGRSNVGKSTLLNRLLGKKGLARTSSTPGRTQAVNFFLVNDRFYCVDLPGYGYAKAGWDARRAWAGLMDDYLRAAGSSDLGWVVLLVDGVVGATVLDVQAWQYLREIGLEVTVVATKIDKLGRSRWAAALKGIQAALGPESNAAIPFSAKTGIGVTELWRELAPHLTGSQQKPRNTGT